MPAARLPTRAMRYAPRACPPLHPEGKLFAETTCASPGRHATPAIMIAVRVRAEEAIAATPRVNRANPAPHVRETAAARACQ